MHRKPTLSLSAVSPDGNCTCDLNSKDNGLNSAQSVWGGERLKENNQWTWARGTGGRTSQANKLCRWRETSLNTKWTVMKEWDCSCFRCPPQNMHDLFIHLLLWVEEMGGKNMTQIQDGYITLSSEHKLPVKRFSVSYSRSAEYCRFMLLLGYDSMFEFRRTFWHFSNFSDHECS